MNAFASVWQRIRKFARLPVREKFFAIEAIAAIIAFKAAMRVVPVRRLLRLSASRPAHSRRAPEMEQVVRWAYLLMQASRIVPSALCLNQALALQWMLGHRGCATELQFGVAPTEDGFRAHAWLRCGEKIILGGADAAEAYRPLAAAPRARHSELNG